MLQCQGHPVTGSRFGATFAYGHLREVLLISGSRTGSFGNVIAYAIGVYISLSITLIGLPVPAGFGSNGGKLEHGGFRGIFGIQVFDVRSEAYNGAVEEMERLAGTVRTVILIMFMQHHTEVTVQMCLGQTAGKSLIGIEHLLHTGEGIDIQYPGTQLVERQMNARDTRNTIPVETGLLPATGGKSNHFIGFSGKICMLPCAR